MNQPLQLAMAKWMIENCDKCDEFGRIHFKFKNIDCPACGELRKEIENED